MIWWSCLAGIAHDEQRLSILENLPGLFCRQVILIVNPPSEMFASMVTSGV